MRVLVVAVLGLRDLGRVGREQFRRGGQGDVPGYDEFRGVLGVLGGGVPFVRGTGVVSRVSGLVS